MYWLVHLPEEAEIHAIGGTRVWMLLRRMLILLHTQQRLVPRDMGEIRQSRLIISTNQAAPEQYYAIQVLATSLIAERV
jgi:hypothetical protein